MDFLFNELSPENLRILTCEEGDSAPNTKKVKGVPKIVADEKFSPPINYKMLQTVGKQNFSDAEQ